MINQTEPAQPLETAEALETPRTLAAILRTTPQSVNAWHRKGILPARIAIGRVIRFDRNEALAALAEHSKREAFVERVAQ